jgi:hypothetical protein
MKVNTMVKKKMAKLFAYLGSEINSEGRSMKRSVGGYKMALNFKRKFMEQRNLKVV